MCKFEMYVFLYPFVQFKFTVYVHKQASRHTNIYSVDRGGEVGTMGNGGHECGCTITCPELNQS